MGPKERAMREKREKAVLDAARLKESRRLAAFNAAKKARKEAEK